LCVERELHEAALSVGNGSRQREPTPGTANDGAPLPLGQRSVYGVHRLFPTDRQRQQRVNSGRQAADKIMRPLVGRPFSGLTERDKLFIFAHGNNDGIAWMTAANAGGDNALELAEFLRKYGLWRVGLITFKACFVGRAQFLRHFAEALAAKGIAAGWLKGYKGIAETDFKPGGTGAHNDGRGTNLKPYERVTRSKKDPTELVNDSRVRIVRGPGRLFEGQNFGRYLEVTSASDPVISEQAAREFLED
jgi:hypothetical protein